VKAYADTSFLLSLYGRDVNSHAAIALVQRNHPVFVVTPFGETEFTSTVFAITARPRGWSIQEARAIEADLVRDLATGTWEWEDFPPETWLRARELARRHASVLPFRALDALHVASALILTAHDFYTFDRDQAKLARAEGLRVVGA
jgi:predicted nucleic acid-binding protein